jgi:GAF domain-containing protein
MDRDALARIGDVLAAQPDRQRAIELLLSEARRLTRAEAGTVYVREGNRLRFAAVQNDVLARRLGEEEARRRLAAEPLALIEPSVASYVALTRATVNISDVYELPPERPYRFDRYMDAVHGYRTRSMLAMPLRDGRGEVFGAIQLINALDDAGEVVAFDREAEELVGALLAHFARAIAALGRASGSAG